MATKRMYRLLNLSNGEISVNDWCFDGYVALNEIIVDYDDQIRPEHAKMVAEAIDARVKKMNADIVVMENKKQDFLAIAYQHPQEQPKQDSEWEEVDG